jgi:hypothetical protein
LTCWRTSVRIKFASRKFLKRSFLDESSSTFSTPRSPIIGQCPQSCTTRISLGN